MYAIKAPGVKKTFEYFENVDSCTVSGFSMTMMCAGFSYFQRHVDQI